MNESKNLKKILTNISRYYSISHHRGQSFYKSPHNVTCNSRTLQLISIASGFNHGVIVSNNDTYHWRLILLIIHITSRCYGPVCVTKLRIKEENGFPTALCRDIACNRVHARACLSRLPARFLTLFRALIKIYILAESRARR